jgi:hypothetical protein
MDFEKVDKWDEIMVDDLVGYLVVCSVELMEI